MEINLIIPKLKLKCFGTLNFLVYWLFFKINLDFQQQNSITMPIVKTLTIVDARYLEQVRQFWIENNYMKCLSITIDRQLWLTLVKKFKASLDQSRT